MIAAALSLIAVVASAEGTERRWTPIAREAATPDGGRPKLCCRVDPYKPGSRFEAKLASPGGVPTADCVFMFSTGASHCPAGTKSLAPSDGSDYSPSDWVE